MQLSLPDPKLPVLPRAVLQPLGTLYSLPTEDETTHLVMWSKFLTKGLEGRINQQLIAKYATLQTCKSSKSHILNLEVKGSLPS